MLALAACGDPAPRPAIAPPTLTSTATPPLSASAPEPEPSVTAEPAPKPVAHRFAVATENALATRAAIEVLEHGGSAGDAAIAAVLVMGVVHPVSSGLGGGGFALVYDAAKRSVSSIDFREVAPTGLRPNDFVKRPPLEKKRGVMVGVPGEVAGLFMLHDRLGKKPFSDDAAAAIEAADKGFEVSPHLARTLKFTEGWIKKTPELGLLDDHGEVLAARATAKNPALAATLRALASGGRAAFYEGAIAKDVVATARSVGGRLDERDLKKYVAIDRAPLRATWEGFEVATMDAPSAGGLLVLEALRMHSKSDLTTLGYGSGAYLHLLAETFRGAIADRMRWLGDPAFVKRDLDELASPARMKARRATISLDSTNTAERFALAESGTSHVIIVDEAGNVVSITSTINDMFGAHLVTKSGFVLNDDLDDFTAQPLEKRFGVPARAPSAPHGGARPVSSMTPVIVLDHGVPVLALGGSGGTRVATGVAQVLLARLAFDRALASAISDPRIETPMSGGLVVDAFVAPAIVQDLRKRGEVVDATSPNYSAVQGIALGDRDGLRFLQAVSDPRKGGSAFVE